MVLHVENVFSFSTKLPCALGLRFKPSSVHSSDPTQTSHGAHCNEPPAPTSQTISRARPLQTPHQQIMSLDTASSVRRSRAISPLRASASVSSEAMCSLAFCKTSALL